MIALLALRCCVERVNGILRSSAATSAGSSGDYRPLAGSYPHPQFQFYCQVFGSISAVRLWSDWRWRDLAFRLQ